MYKKLFIRIFFCKKIDYKKGAHFKVKNGEKKQSISKIFACIVLCFFILISESISAQILEKKISIHIRNKGLEQALKQVSEKAKIRLVYENKIWKETVIINEDFVNKSLQEIFEKLLANANIAYEIINDQYILLRKKVDPKKDIKIEENILSSIPPTIHNGFLLEGIVKDENNHPLSGVNVSLKDATQVAETNTNGFFNIGIPKEGSIVVFSYVGFQTAEVKVNNKDRLDIQMKSDPANLDEVVVIGYGTTTKRMATGSQSGINAKELEKQPVTNVLQALQGRLPGVFITQTNGLPGAGINVQIRGANSISKSNRPLYIIDGVPFLSAPINTATGSSYVLPSAEGNTSPMNTINPQDIENIEVLKDADATAIYGSRGANGVVLITTKKGRDGGTKFNANISTGNSKVSHEIKMLDIAQYLKLRRKAFENKTLSSVTPSATNAPDLTVWDTTQNTNWQKELLGNTAHTTDMNASLSGGNRLTNFYLSGSYHKEGNVFPGEQNYKRGGINLNLNHSSLNQKFNLSLSAIYSADKNNISTTDLASYAYTLPPNYPLYNPNGTLYWLPGSIGSLPNPLGYLQQTNDNKSSNLLTNLNLKYSIIKGLDIKTSIGYSKTEMDQTTIRPLTSLSTAYLVPTSGTSAFSNNYTNNFIAEPQITYNKEIGEGVLNILAGASYQNSQSRQPYYVSASGFSSDDFLTNISSATTVNTLSSSQNYKYVSLLSRINYRLLNRYIINVNIRRDGSSRFGPNNKFGNFGSVGAAWIFSEESFLKNKNTILSFGKIRGSYGVVGSDDIGNYQYLETYTSSTYLYNGVSSLNPTRIANGNFKWEQTRKMELGLELGFFKDRLSFNGSYYRNRSSNQLLNFPLSAQTGFISYQSNLPATVQNSGIELSFTTTNIKKNGWEWTSSFNYTKNRNKLLSFPDIEKTSYYTSYVIGNPISAFYLYQYVGIDPNTNLPVFTDFSENSTTASPSSGLLAIGRGDRYFVGTSLPNFYGGLTNSISYKGFTFDFTFQYVKQKGRSLTTSSFYPPGYMANMAASVANDYLALGSEDYLVTASTSTINGRASYLAYLNYSASDATFIDASFIRLKNVSLSYNLPKQWMARVKNLNIKVFVHAQNLFTITNYKGFDPESQGIVTPPLRTIVAGLQLNF